MKLGFPVLVLSLAGFAASVGSPAWLLDVECQGMANRCTKVIVACTYLSVQGRRVMIPHWEPDQQQRCPQVILIPLSWPLLQWKA